MSQEMNGVIVKELPKQLYKVALEEGGRQLVCHLDRMTRLQLVRLIKGDSVVVVIADRNASRGKILRRVSS